MKKEQIGKLFSQFENACYENISEKSGSMPDIKGLSLIELLEKLRVADDSKLKRAALILFGKDPGRFYPNLTVKMGRFGKDDDDSKFQETEEGNLIQLL